MLQQRNPADCPVDRRSIFLRGVALLGTLCTVSPAVAAAGFEVTRTDEEWRVRLTQEGYRVLRRQGTERAGSSPLNEETRRGTYHCAGCALPLYRSDTKFDSHTGWPSFWIPIEGSVATSADRGLFGVRTEVHCHRCGGHLGHVFEDGPRPTGRRYCMNGVALTFEAAS